MLALWILFLLFMSLVGLVLFAAFSNKKAEQLLPPAGSFAKLGSTRLHYVDQGQGPAIVMVHGLAGNLQNFTYGVAAPLAQNHRVICVDRPGCGYSKALIQRRCQFRSTSRYHCELARPFAN
jgi:pimeloyl-ACP methyl ester carboxylesterase